MPLGVVVLHCSKRLNHHSQARRPAGGAAASRRRRKHDGGEKGAACGRGEGAGCRAKESLFDVANVAALGWGGDALQGQCRQQHFKWCIPMW